MQVQDFADSVEGLLVQLERPDVRQFYQLEASLSISAQWTSSSILGRLIYFLFLILRRMGK